MQNRYAVELEIVLDKPLGIGEVDRLVSKWLNGPDVQTNIRAIRAVDGEIQPGTQAETKYTISAAALYVIAQGMFQAGRDYGRENEESYDRSALELRALDHAFVQLTEYHKRMGAIEETNSVGKETTTHAG